MHKFWGDKRVYLRERHKAMPANSMSRQNILLSYAKSTVDVTELQQYTQNSRLARMDPATAGGLAIGVASLVFDVFDNCVKGMTSFI